MGDTKRQKDKPTLPSVPHFKDETDADRDDAPLAKTVRMEAAPRPSSAPLAAAMHESPAVPRASDGRIELVVVEEPQLAGSERKPWRAAEIWTKRRVYGLDSSFKCFEILDRETGRTETSHELVGARLGGGRLRDEETVRFSYPYPVPGMEAMFMKGKKYGYTSAVERMILRVRLLHTAAGQALPTWEDVASRWSEPPGRP